MSREIKFRGQTRRKGERIINMAGDKCEANWVYGGVFPQNNGGDFAIIYEQPSCEKRVVYADTVGQYIGITDKNGKEIYDGDIVKMHQFLFDGDEYEKEIIVSIEYMEDMACFGANLLQAKEIRAYMGYNNETDKEEKVVVPLCNFYGLHEESFEVIGNVYENADLLEEVDDNE